MTPSPKAQRPSRPRCTHTILPGYKLFQEKKKQFSSSRRPFTPITPARSGSRHDAPLFSGHLTPAHDRRRRPRPARRRLSGPSGEAAHRVTEIISANILLRAVLTFWVNLWLYFIPLYFSASSSSFPFHVLVHPSAHKLFFFLHLFGVSWVSAADTLVIR